jgi:AraC-like DNA-binding protein
MTALVRAAGISGYEELAASLGIDVASALRRARISVKALRDPDGLLSYASVIGLLEQSAHDAGCPDFGIRLAGRQGSEVLGPIAIVMQHARTVLEALSLGSKYVSVQSPALRFAVEPVAGRSSQTDLRVAIDVPYPAARRQAFEHALCVVIKFLDLLSQGTTKAQVVLLPHAQLAPSGTYASAFGCPSRFNQPFAAVRVATGSLARELPLHNPALLEFAQKYIDANFARPDQTISSKVRELVQRLMGTGCATHEGIAETLGVHPRTLQRQLVSEGTSFERIKDDARRTLFRQLMDRPAPLPLGQVASMLGYAEQSALTRSCRRWFGVAPSSMRR